MNIIAIIGIILAYLIVIICWIFVVKKTKQNITEIQQTYLKQKEILNELELEKERVSIELKDKEKSLTDINDEIKFSQHLLETLAENLDKQTQAQNNLKDRLFKETNEEVDKYKQQTYNTINKEIEDYKTEQKILKEKMTKQFEEEKENFERILQEYRDKQNSIIKINKEQEELREQTDFYKINLSNEDKTDIQFLESIKSKLNRPEIISKLIYKTYYETQYTSLVGRVIGTKKITGIYKITNLNNNMVYIGQSVDIAERWRQHLKRALGAENGTNTNIKLYNAMYNEGPENFSWQIVETCPKEKLTEREKYWIQFYDGQGYGYNTKG